MWEWMHKKHSTGILPTDGKHSMEKSTPEAKQQQQQKITKIKHNL